VNPDDVKSAWHYLCVAREESPAAARAALLPVGPDSRQPMRDIYDMFRGTRTAEQVLAAAGPEPAARFYGHLCVGLFLEATGMRSALSSASKVAADDRFQRVGYMHMVARVHVRAGPNETGRHRGFLTNPTPI
jgi:hypothetical protein